MTTARQKGAYYELKTKKLLEKEGYQVEKANARIIWINGRPVSKHHDFFELFDLIAVNEREVLFVQVRYRDEDDSKVGDAAWFKKAEAFPSPEGTKQLWKWRKQGKKVVLKKTAVR